MSKPLFRKEAIDAQREKFLGEVSVARPLSLWFFTFLAVAIAAILIAVAVWGQYTRRERVAGYLASEVGNVPLLISDAGQVKDITVHEGDTVKAGDPIANVSIDRTLSSAASSSDAVLHEMNSRKQLLIEELADTERLGRTQIEQINTRASDLEKEIHEADEAAKLQSTRLQSAKEVAKRYENLAKQQFVSDVGALQKQDDVTDQEIKLQALVRERASLAKDLAAARMDAPTAQLRTKASMEQITRQISELEQSTTEESLLRLTVIRAPIAGTVTNIGVTQGQVVASNTPLATIIPKDNTLHVELMVPTRAIGFVKPGQDVQLRYEAFPYERFGQYAGTIESVGKTVWMQGETVGPVPLKEPAYRIIVKLKRQDVSANGQELPLRPGMLVSADLLMERRTLLAWLFQPLLQLRERTR